jgi:hypothetical protein
MTTESAPPLPRNLLRPVAVAGLVLWICIGVIALLGLGWMGPLVTALAIALCVLGVGGAIGAMAMGELASGRDRLRWAIPRTLALVVLSTALPCWLLVGALPASTSGVVLAVAHVVMVVAWYARSTLPDPGSPECQRRLRALGDPALEQALVVQATALGYPPSGIRVDPQPPHPQVDVVGGARPVLLVSEVAEQQLEPRDLTALVALSLARHRYRGLLTRVLWLNLVVLTAILLHHLALPVYPIVTVAAAALIWAYLTPVVRWLWIRLEDRCLARHADPGPVVAVLRRLWPRSVLSGAPFCNLWYRGCQRDGRIERISGQPVEGRRPARGAMVLLAAGALGFAVCVGVLPLLGDDLYLDQRMAGLIGVAALPFLLALFVTRGAREEHRSPYRSLLVTPPWWASTALGLWLAWEVPTGEVQPLSWVLLGVLVLSAAVAWFVAPIWERIARQPY